MLFGLGGFPFSYAEGNLTKSITKLKLHLYINLCYAPVSNRGEDVQISAFNLLGGDKN